MSELAAGADEILEDGANANTPDGDNLVLDYVRAEAAAYRDIAQTNGGRTFTNDELGLHLTDLALPTPFGNTAHLTRPITAATRPLVVDALRDFYLGVAGGPALLFSSWPTPDLSADGFAPVGHPPLMLRLSAPTPPTDFDIRRVRDEGGLADFERTMIEAYPVVEMQPWVRGSFLAPAILDTAWHLFVAYDDGRPVATAGAYVTDRLLIVELVSARPETRGRGVGAAITAAATAAASDRPAMLIASDLGQGVYRGLGYLSLLRQSLWILPRRP
jgi:GNAT superfamily N-acetyltransferase